VCVCVFQCVFKRIQTYRRTSKRLDVTVEDGMNLFEESKHGSLNTVNVEKVLMC
jgi:hypothetical protein